MRRQMISPLELIKKMMNLIDPQLFSGRFRDGQECHIRPREHQIILMIA